MNVTKTKQKKFIKTALNNSVYSKIQKQKRMKIHTTKQNKHFNPSKVHFFQNSKTKQTNKKRKNIHRNMYEKPHPPLHIFSNTHESSTYATKI